MAPSRKPNRFYRQRRPEQALLRRVYDIDALVCPCGGRLSFVELINTQRDAKPILERLGLPADPPRLRDKPPPDDRDTYQDVLEADWNQPSLADDINDLPDLEAPDPLPDDW